MAMNWLKKMLQKPTAMELAIHDLEEAKRMLLKFNAEYEYSMNMVKYLEMQLDRLSKYVQNV